MSVNKKIIETESAVPLEAFNIVTYSGTSASHSITGVGFQPDFVWLKSITQIDNHYWQDSSRGATRRIYSNQTLPEYPPDSNRFTSFDADGFTVGSDNSVNMTGHDYVAWCWKMNGGSTTTTSGVARQVNSTYGQAILTYAGDDTSNRYVTHGIGTAPRVVITKARDFTAGWPTQIDLYYGNRLNSNAANNAGNGAVFYTNWPPSTTQYRIGFSDEINFSAYNYVSYVFASIAGYSNMGSYVGNSTNRTITTGFQPDWIMIKTMNTTGDWQVWDSVRGFNKKLSANTDAAESTTSVITGVSSTGFSITSDSTVNGSGTEYAYLAFKIS